MKFLPISLAIILAVEQGADAFAPLRAASVSTSLNAANNIVLSPSEDKEAFDSLKIGGARVHRYAKEDDPESEATEYVMWYHGRSIEQDSDKTLPPLSTGRIGRATSRNGLLWKKDETGSLSEDKEDCSLGLNQESWWGFDTAHVGLGNVLLPISTPAVVTEGGVYLMYYMGGSFEETPIVDYVDKDLPADAMIKGMRMRIGVCVSQDGVTWGRVEGDDPSGACMNPYVKDDPNLVDIGIMTDDDGTPVPIREELYCAWPDVVVKQDNDEEQGGFLMYYSTMTKDDKQKSIAYATSSDGFRWYKGGVCVEPEAGTLDSDGCARCSVVRNAVFVEGNGWLESEGYTMYYEGVSNSDSKHRIMVAESPDGMAWTKKGVALDIGDEDGSWDNSGVGSPHILRLDDGSQRMYYTGQGPNQSTAIGVANLPKGDKIWQREQATITFAEVV